MTHPASPVKFRNPSAYFELAKLRLVALVLLSTAVGCLMALRHPLDGLSFLHVLLGTGLVASGSLVLNQWLEHHHDALMKRAEKRPIPSGQIAPKRAFAFGLLLSLAGLVYLDLAAFHLTALLAAVTLLSYLLIYIPLKRLTTLNTLVGAVPGALPPLIGWSAAYGTLAYEAWVLFMMMFLWQIPHFLSIAWLYRNDYETAGFKMLSLGDETGGRVARQAAVYSTALIPVLAGLTGAVYFVMAILLGGLLLAASIAAVKDIEKRAPHLFAASNIYLSVILVVMVADKN